jgi:hypothetical protein
MPRTNPYIQIIPSTNPYIVEDDSAARIRQHMLTQEEYEAAISNIGRQQNSAMRLSATEVQAFFGIPEGAATNPNRTGRIDSDELPP